MCLQRVGTEHRGDLVEREPVKRLSMGDRGENVFCHLRHNHIFDKKPFPKSERRRYVVVERDPLKELLREVVRAPTFPCGNSDR